MERQRKRIGIAKQYYSYVNRPYFASYHANIHSALNSLYMYVRVQYNAKIYFGSTRRNVFISRSPEINFPTEI